MSILEQFANGDIHPHERACNNDPEYRSICHELESLKEKLFHSLGEADKKMFEEFLEIQLDESNLHDISTFIHGYRLGALMTMEVFTYNNEL